jgi:hypothetical protein
MHISTGQRLLRGYNECGSLECPHEKVKAVFVLVYHLASPGEMYSIGCNSIRCKQGYYDNDLEHSFTMHQTSRTLDVHQEYQLSCMLLIPIYIAILSAGGCGHSSNIVSTPLTITFTSAFVGSSSMTVYSPG